MKTKAIVLILTSTLVFLTACDNSTTTTQNQQALQQSIKVENVAWMREKLPADTFAYARIPTLWQLMFEAKADSLHSAQKQDAHKQIINNIKKGIVDTYANKLPKEAQIPFELLLKNMTSPLEVAVIDASDGSIAPNVMIATTLQNTTKEQLNDLVNLIAKQSNQQLRVIKALDDSGFANLFVAMAPIFLSFDEKTGRLLMLSGLSASQEQLQDLLANTSHAPELNDILTYENSIDASGKNIETWVNVDAIYQKHKTMIPANQQEMVTKLGLDQMKFLWVGTASSAGKSELIFKIAMPEVGARQLVAGVNSQFDVQTAGIPRSAWQITRPTVEQIKNAYEFALTFTPDAEKIRAKTNETLGLLTKYFGVSIAEMLGIYGQKIVIVSDDSGTWFSSKINDIKAHNELIEKFKKTFKLTLETKTLAGVSIDVMEASTSEFTQKFINDLDLDIPTFNNQLFDIKQKSYFQIKGDKYIQALIPQVLADRDNSKNKQKLSNWLKNQQGQNWNSSLLAYTTEVHDAPRDIYHLYLKMLEVMGTLTNSDVDLFTMPTSQQLNLPKKGQFSFALDADNDGFSIKISYEYSIFENMSYFNGYMAIMYLGVASAYAVPAYRDYSVRLKVSQKISSHAKSKDIITEFYSINNKFPDDDYFHNNYINADEYDYNSENGEITFYFTKKDDKSLAHSSFTFKPDINQNDKNISWKCFSTARQNVLPNNCTKKSKR